MILGMDFIRMFDIESRREQTEWRVRKLRRSNGALHKFWQTGNERLGIFAECTGICAVEPEDREKLNELVDTILGAEGRGGRSYLPNRA